VADLTTLANVKEYLAITTSGQDALIPKLIARESRHIERWTSRTFPYVQNTGKRLNGTGTSVLMLPDQPIIAIQALTICGVDVPAAPDDQSAGYLFDDVAIYLGAGQIFPMGRQNVLCSWTSGYKANVPATIPDANVPTITVLDPGIAVQVAAVTGADGTVFTLAANAPAPGEYAFEAPTFTFNAANANTAVYLDCYYVPGPVEQGCIEMVGLDLKGRDNLGIASKTLAGETISYQGGAMTSSVKEMLQPFKKMVPV